jgi:hypothetical protein
MRCFPKRCIVSLVALLRGWVVDLLSTMGLVGQFKEENSWLSTTCFSSLNSKVNVMTGSRLNLM